MRKVKDDQEKAQQEHEEIKAEVDSKEKKFEKFKKWVQSVNDIGFSDAWHPLTLALGVNDVVNIM